MERKVGETFKVKGETFMVVEDDSEFCYGCYFFEKGGCGSYNPGLCSPKERSDGRGVTFKKLDDPKPTSGDTGHDLEVRTMDFSRVLHYLKNGAVARRKSWSGSKSIFLAKDVDGMLPFFCINTKDGHRGVYTGTACDLLAEDWEVIEE